MNDIDDINKKINEFEKLESETKGAFRTYTSKLKELGINNTKEAEAKLKELDENNKSLNNQIELLKLDISEKLKDIEDKLNE